MRWLHDGDFSEATEVLSDFVLGHANTMREELGFGWYEVDAAPSSFDSLLETYFQCHEHGTDYPVARAGSATSIYPSPQVNAAFRFWHDITHLRLHCSFDYWDERAVGEFHLRQLEDAGLARESLPWLLLRADTIGQNEFSRLSGGGFVADQRAFAYAAVEHGLGVALLQELTLHDRVPPGLLHNPPPMLAVAA